MKNPQSVESAQLDGEYLGNLYDIVIIGSGSACSYTMVHYISLLTVPSPNQPVRIAVVEKSGEFWTGVPYGKRSSSHSLIISSLKEFLPPPELESFKSWLSKNSSWVFQPLVEEGAGGLAKKWMKSYEDDMANGLWDNLYVPRFTFGCYLKERLEQLIQDATAKGIVKCDKFNAEATDVQLVDDLYQIEIVQQSKASLHLNSKKVVLAIGSPPNKDSDNTLYDVNVDSSRGTGVLYMHNMYKTSQSDSINLICSALKQSDNPKHNQVVIIGSNASAIESVYSLVNATGSNDLISKFIIVSPNGTFPHRTTPPSSNYEPQCLKILNESKCFTAEDILTAVKKDVDSALAQNESVGSSYAAISKGIIEALNNLNQSEQELFVSKYGVEIGKFQRRAGADYLDVVEDLVSKGKLEFIKGKFVKSVSLECGGTGFEFSTADNPENQIFSTPVKVIINCAGFQDLYSSSSVLIRNLVARGICIPNDSRNGFKINENFETSKNFYLMGPLIAGNMNSRFRVWHAESVPRIISMSQMLAETLVQS